MDISVIIINFHSSKFTIDCIKSIYTHTDSLEFEIIVVDNNSSSTDLETLEKYIAKKDIKLIKSKINLGFGGGNQLGYQFAQGKYLAFVNNDTKLIENSLFKLFNYIKSNTEIGVLGLNQIDEDKKSFKYNYRQFINLKYHLIGHKKPITYYSKKYGPEAIKSPFEVDIVSGAFMFFDTKKYEECGGFDSNIFLFYEEMDICSRLSKLGYKTVFYPDSTFIHYQGKSSENIAINKEFVISYLYVIQKNYSYIYYLSLKAILFIKYSIKTIVKPKKYLPLVSVVVKGGNSLIYSLKLSSRS